jgi:YegS/Rv2252/BmrU family lipid kinase
VGVTVVWTERRGDAAEAAATANGRTVIAVGGDGTIHEVVNGLLRRSGTERPRFGALRAGTGGDFCRSLPGPRDPALVPAWIHTSRFQPIDAARAATSSGRRFFINAADAGIGARIARRAVAAPALLGGTARYLGAAAWSLMVHRNVEVRVRLDDGPTERLRVWTIVVANGGYAGSGMWLAPDARLDDGWLDVVIIGDIGRPLAIRSLPLLYRGQHGRLAQVRFARARRVEIEAETPTQVQADGELVGETPAVFEVLPHALDVLTLASA